MKLSLRIVAGLWALSVSSVGIPQQWDGNPLVIRGFASLDGLQTKYSIEFKNVSRDYVIGICVREAGVAIQSRQFNPSFELPNVAPGQTHTLNVWIRGNIAPLPEASQIGVRASYRVGSKTINTFIPAWDNCRRSGR